MHALGLILVELLTGRPALEGEETADFLIASTGPERPTPAAKGVIVPEAVESLCARCLSTVPADRFANAGELLAALDAALALPTPAADLGAPAGDRPAPVAAGTVLGEPPRALGDVGRRRRRNGTRAEPPRALGDVPPRALAADSSAAPDEPRRPRAESGTALAEPPRPIPEDPSSPLTAKRRRRRKPRGKTELSPRSPTTEAAGHMAVEARPPSSDARGTGFPLPVLVGLALAACALFVVLLFGTSMAVARRHVAAPGGSAAAAVEWDHSGAAIPVSAEDPIWGNLDAPVTIVEISDFECPFCSRVEPTIEQVKSEYGPEKVRIVWKNNPLPFHKNARAAHEASVAVFEAAGGGQKGSEAFWKFHALAFGHQKELSAENFEKWAQQAGADVTAWKTEFESSEVKAKVDRDLAMARTIGAGGAPNFRVNGVEISGAQPLEKFKEVIDRELSESERMLTGGTPAREIYLERVKNNLAVRVGASHVLIAYQGATRAKPDVTRTKEQARELAEQVAARIKKGEEFAKVAQELSDCSSKSKGGDLGTFTRDHMTPAFSRAAFALKVGEMSGVVETPFGCHVIMRTQ